MTSPELQEIVDNFALFDDWEERYRYLIDLGRALPSMDDSLKNDQTFVPGCTSKVWLVVEIRGGVLHIVADSDAHIVRGLVALLLMAYQGRTIDEIRALDIESLFREIGLDQHLSPNRRNGFFAMVERIRSIQA
jgi:cysteine desulfuration protein SufE